VPWVLVIGDQEATSGAVTVRTHGHKGQRSLPKEDFLTEVLGKIRARDFEP
jgi:threonyl-tRNA synthetase